MFLNIFVACIGFKFQSARKTNVGVSQKTQVFQTKDVLMNLKAGSETVLPLNFLESIIQISQCTGNISKSAKNVQHSTAITNNKELLYVCYDHSEGVECK